jgi:hypothetical protein
VLINEADFDPEKHVLPNKEVLRQHAETVARHEAEEREAERRLCAAQEAYVSAQNAARRRQIEDALSVGAGGQRPSSYVPKPRRVTGLSRQYGLEPGSGRVEVSFSDGGKQEYSTWEFTASPYFAHCLAEYPSLVGDLRPKPNATRAHVDSLRAKRDADLDRAIGRGPYSEARYGPGSAETYDKPEPRPKKPSTPRPGWFERTILPAFTANCTRCEKCDALKRVYSDVCLFCKAPFYEPKKETANATDPL